MWLDCCLWYWILCFNSALFCCEFSFSDVCVLCLHFSTLILPIVLSYFVTKNLGFQLLGTKLSWIQCLHYIGGIQLQKAQGPCICSSEEGHIWITIFFHIMVPYVSEHFTVDDTVSWKYDTFFLWSITTKPHCFMASNTTFNKKKEITFL